ncbi:MAG: SAM-dependent chlorinase/fluorinase [Candidatus Limnocylindrales bacterium]
MPRTFLQPETTPAAIAADPSAGRGRPFVSLTTDFGARDPSTAICVGVVHAIAPDATVMTVTAEIAKFKIRDGALTLWATLPYLPVGAHVAVVDPGVGTERHPLAVATARGDVLVGPDNGLLIPAAERLGGVTAAHRLEAREYQLPVVSTSFHGRDVFAPAAAHLVNGVPIEAFGPALDPAELVRLEWPEARVREETLETAIVYVDSFGNIKLVGEVADLEAAVGPLAPADELRLRWSDESGARDAVVPWVETFGRVAEGAPLAYEDAYGRICLAANQAAGADVLGLREGLTLTIGRA